MQFPLKLAQFLAMAQVYNDACVQYWACRGDNLKNMRKYYDNRRLRYEGWLIGFLDGVGGIDYPQHQELAMRIVREAFVVEEKPVSLKDDVVQYSPNVEEWR